MRIEVNKPILHTNAKQSGIGLLHALVLDEFVMRSVEDYEALILELATKPEKLKAIKIKLAKSLTSKPVFDTKTYTQNFEQIIKTLDEVFKARLLRTVARTKRQTHSGL